MSRIKIEELVQLEAEHRLDELRAIRNELAMMHCAIMEMRTRSITTEEMISTLRAEVRDLKAGHAKCTVVLKDSSCGTESSTTVDASTNSGTTLTNASTSTEEPQMKHVSVGVETAQVHVGIKTDEVETSDAVVDMGITASDVAVMVFPTMRNVEVSAFPRMKNASTNTVVRVRRHPSPTSGNETQETLGKSTTFTSMTNLPCFTTSSCSNSEHGLKKDKAVYGHASGDQTSRKRKTTDSIAEQCRTSPHQEEQRIKILEKIKTFERFIAKTKKRKFGGQVCQSLDEIQCIFCGRINEHYDDNCPVVRSAEARLCCAQRRQICLMCLSESCSGGPSCPRKDVPCVYCVEEDANNSRTHHRSFCFRPERYDQFKKQLDILHEKLNELDCQR